MQKSFDLKTVKAWLEFSLNYVTFATFAFFKIYVT